MSPPVPDVDLLRAYCHGELRAEDEAEVRRWLVVHANPEVLSLCDALVAERERRRLLLASRAAQPLRAKLERAFWRVRSRLGPQLATIIDADREQRLSLAVLGSSHAEESTIEAPLEEPIYLRLELSAPCYVAAYALESSGRMEVLLNVEALHPAGSSIDLPGIILERREDRLELYVLLDTEAPPPVPDAKDGPEWLAERFELISASTTAWLLKRTLVPVGTSRLRGP
jgi:hypothetical protein